MVRNKVVKRGATIEEPGKCKQPRWWARPCKERVGLHSPGIPQVMFNQNWNTLISLQGQGKREECLKRISPAQNWWFHWPQGLSHHIRKKLTGLPEWQTVKLLQRGWVWLHHSIYSGLPKMGISVCAQAWAQPLESGATPRAETGTNVPKQDSWKQIHLEI